LRTGETIRIEGSIVDQRREHARPSGGSPAAAPAFMRRLMELGRHLRELTRLRVGVVICVLVATFAALSVNYKISLLPPGLHQRSLTMAAASTEVLIDTPTSVVLDLRQNTGDMDALTNRSVLIGNVMASTPVRAYIGRRIGQPGDAIQATTPRTPNSPRPFQTAENRKRTTDLLASTDQYRLNIVSDPTVPVLTIYAQAPSARAAGELANAAVDGLRDYLGQVGRSQRIPDAAQIRVAQLGRARGTVINGGVGVQATMLAFLFFFAVAAAATIFVARVRRGFRLAEEHDNEVGRLDGGEPVAPALLAADRDLVAR
jgi:hypothetical protein